MNTSALHDNIPKLFHWLVEQIQQQNGLNRNNQTVDAEDLFCNILNTAFNWNLINANLNHPNQDTFDLNSIDNKRFVQVTSNQSHRTKLEQTLQSATDKGYELIVVIFIAKALPKKLPKKGKIGDTEFEVFDVNTLYRKIRYTSLPDVSLQQINSWLENFTKPILSYEISNNQAKTSVGLPKRQTIQRKSRFFIERTELITELYQYAQKDNGLIIGGPGTGKSFVIGEFLRFCETKGVPSYVILINELLGATDDDISKELSISNGEWLEVLCSGWTAKSDKGLLIFDGFDTAKDETVKKDVLIQIQRAIARLSSDWSVLVSVRTYDAAKSPLLVQMFPHISSNEPVSCRTFSIPEFTTSELLNFLTTVPRLINTYQKSTPALQRLLLIPYFLGLFVDVVNDTNSPIQPLLEVETEEQLLKIYWQRKVVGNSLADLLLFRLTGELLKTQKLSCKKASLLTDSTDRPVLESLLSLGILSESSVSWQLVSFNHNILLEYAVSLYNIPEDADELISFISANPRFLFSFRQSFVYFYSRLWNISNQLFWTHYNLVRSSKEPIHRLFHQSVLNYVLGSLYHSYDQLKPLLSLPEKNDRNVAIRKLLEGILFLKKKDLTEMDDEMFYQFSQDLSVTYAWQLGFLINRAINELNPEEDAARWKKLSETANLYMEWVLTERQVPEQKRGVDLVAGRLGIKGICKTFKKYPDKTSEQLQRAVDILQEQEFPQGYYQELEEHIASIFECDKLLGTTLFKTLYLFNETSSKETFLGSGVVRGFRSNRRQDFEMLHHRLEERYEELLDIDSERSIIMGLEIINEIFGNQKPYGREWILPLTFYGQSTVLMADYSFYDSGFDDDTGPLSLLHKIFKRIENFINNGNDGDASEYIKLFVHARTARIWRGLLQLLSKYPEQTKRWSLELIQNESIIICNETTQAAAELLKILWPQLMNDEKIMVEKKIIQLQYNTSYNAKFEFLTRRIKRLVGVLPKEELQLEDTKLFIEEHSTSDNHPIMHYSGLQRYVSTEEEKFADAGVDKSNEAEVAAYQLTEELISHKKPFINLDDKKPTTEQIKSFLPLTQKLYSLVQTKGFNERLTYWCDSIVSEICELLSRVAEKLNAEELSFVQEAALGYINDSSYQVTAYETGAKDEKTYEVTPRITATTILKNLLFANKSDIIASALEPLFADNSERIRFQATHALNWYYCNRRSFWLHIIPERLAKEQNGFTYCELIHGVNYQDVVRDNRVFIETLIIQIEKQLSVNTEPVNRAIWQRYTSILLQLLVSHKSEIASDIIFSNTYNASFVEDSGRFIINHIRPKSAHAHDEETKKYLLDILQRLLADSFGILQSYAPEDENAAPFYKMLDRIITILWGIFRPLNRNNKDTDTTKQELEDLYRLVKPVIVLLLDESEKIGSGFMIAHTAYSLLQLLNTMLYFDATEIFFFTTRIVNTAAVNGFTYDDYTMKEIVWMVETILADHRFMLDNPVVLQNLIILLDHFTDSGREEPLELVWRIREAM